MKKYIKALSLSLPLLFSIACAAQSNPTQVETVSNCANMSETDASKILGDPVRLVSATRETAGISRQMKCTYDIVSKAPPSKDGIKLYFMLEETASADAAKKIYDSIFEGNKSHAGIKVLSDLGDQAYAQTDQPYFTFLMVRKGKFTIRLKINRAPESTSFDEARSFAERLMKQI